MRVCQILSGRRALLSAAAGGSQSTRNGWLDRVFFVAKWRDIVYRDIWDKWVSTNRNISLDTNVLHMSTIFGETKNECVTCSDSRRSVRQRILSTDIMSVIGVDKVSDERIPGGSCVGKTVDIAQTTGCKCEFFCFGKKMEYY